MNFNDLLVVAQNYNDSMSSVSALDFSDAFVADWSVARGMVPEPTVMLTGVGLGIAALRRKRY